MEVNKIKDGQLSILSTDGKSWKKRYCTLKKRILYVYENKNKSDESSSSYKILHFIPMARCGVSTTAKVGPNNKPFCFKVNHQMDDSIQYWFSCESEDDMNDWVSQLQASCALQKEPEMVGTIRGRSKSVAFKPMALQLAGISDHSGWLKKQSSSGFSKGQFKKRWFVLKDMVLYIYEGQNSKLKGKVSIPNWKVEEDPSLPLYSFKLSHMGYPPIVLQAETEEERTKWITNIKESDKYLTQPNQPESPKIDQGKNNKLVGWLSSLTTLDIQEPCQFFYNLSFLLNVLDKLGLKVEIPESKEKDREWLILSFDKILKHLQANSIQFDSSLTSHDFINMNQTPVLAFAHSLYDHFNNGLNKSAPKTATTEIPKVHEDGRSEIKKQPEITPTPVPTNNNNSTDKLPTPVEEKPPKEIEVTPIVEPTTTTTTTPPTVNTTDETTPVVIEIPAISDITTDPTILELLSLGEDNNNSLNLRPVNQHLNIVKPTTHSAPTSPMRPVSMIISKHHQKSLKRVDTKDVLNEFDKMFAPFSNNLKKCGKCNEPISGESIEAVGQHFHPQHFECYHCHKHLIDFKKVPYVERNGKIYCKEDHDKLFTESKCSQCAKTIIITYTSKGKIYCKEHYLIEMRDYICQECEEVFEEDQPFYSIEVPNGLKKWHQHHFNCSYCKTPLTDGVCSPKNSMPYCKNCHKILY